MPSDPAGKARAAEILASLDELDVTGAKYPSDVTGPTDRLRWNQSRLVALALYQTFEPSSLPGEYSQELYLMAASIYRLSTSRPEFQSGTLAELATDVRAAAVRGWL